MKPSYNPKVKIAVSLLLLALLLVVSSASAALVITGATTNGGTFIPNWPVANNSLIAGMLPSSVGAGGFAQDYGGGSYGTIAGLPALTDGVLPITGPGTAGTGGHYATCGYDNGSGAYVIYTLPTSANGYNITNISTFTTWGDDAICHEAYAVSYSTVDNPNSFIFLGFVNYAPAGSGGMANRVMLTDSLGGAIAANVAAIKFDFTWPLMPYGVSAYSEITVQGTLAATLTPQPVVIATANQNSASTFDPSSSWTVEAPSLIGGMAPSASVGDATVGGVIGTSALTDGVLGTTGDSSTVGLLGSDNGGCSSLTYTLTGSATGYDLTNIVTYSAWGDYGRDGQVYSVSYSTVTAPTTFIPLTAVEFNPYLAPLNLRSANRVAVNSLTGVLAKNVYSVKFDFPQNNSEDYGDGAYQEIILQGTNSLPPPLPPSPYLVQDTLPLYAQTTVGDQVIFTAAYSNSPPASLQWQVIRGGVTNNVPGATGPILTLNNVQLTNSGFYTLKAVNATNGAAAPSFSSPASLTVSNAVPLVGNIVTTESTQTSGSAATFVPTWPVATNSLIAGLSPSSVGTGDFARNYGGYPSAQGLPALTDGVISPTGKADGLFATCGYDNGAGEYVIYTLPATANGYNITNISTYTTWGDDFLTRQAYAVSYSTVDNPNSFIFLTFVDYKPTSSSPQADRVMLTDLLGGAIAKNVAAIKFNFTWPLMPAGVSAYDEITVQGTPAGTLTLQPVVITTANEQSGTAFVPSWTVETPSLIAGLAPSALTGDPALGAVTNIAGCGSGGSVVLTDGTLGTTGDATTCAALGSEVRTYGSTCSSLTYTLTNSASGYDITNIVTYSAWGDYGRDGQVYYVSYSTVAAPTTFIPLTAVECNPYLSPLGTKSANRVDISSVNGVLASNVYSVKFDFPQNDDEDYGSSSYQEIVVQGTTVVQPTPPILGVPHVSGGNLIVTGTGGTPNSPYTWLSTTNLSAPVVWTTNSTGTLDNAGAFSNSIPIGTIPARFFRLRLP